MSRVGAKGIVYLVFFVFQNLFELPYIFLYDSAAINDLMLLMLLLRVFDVCLAMSSDSKNYFGFVVDKFSELGHTIKSIGSRHTEKRRK